MQSLENRLTALEKSSASNEVPKVIFITYMTPGDITPDIKKLMCTNADGVRQEWVREPAESEEDFKERAGNEATRNSSRIVLLFQDD